MGTGERPKLSVPRIRFRLALRACLKTQRGPAARDFSGGQRPKLNNQETETPRMQPGRHRRVPWRARLVVVTGCKTPGNVMAMIHSRKGARLQELSDDEASIAHRKKL